MNRNRILYVVLIVTVILMGLGTRAKGMPLFVSAYLGDLLWALMVFLIIGAIFNRKSTAVVGFYALITCYMVEISQLYQAEWINAIRATKIGGLTLGYGFLWSDIVAYTVGVAIGVVIEWKWGQSIEGK